VTAGGFEAVSSQQPVFSSNACRAAIRLDSGTLSFYWLPATGYLLPFFLKNCTWYFCTLRLCSARVEAKACEPSFRLTKKR